MLAAVGSFLGSNIVIGWATVLAEVFVGCVIYLELEQNRRTDFLEKATQEEANQDRREIYKTFLAMEGVTTLDERSAAFVRLMLSTPAETVNNQPTLKKRCDRQIALFNNLGITVGEWYSWSAPLVKIFPHAAIYIWIVLHPYIIQRRQDTGDWLAKPLLQFTLKCVTFVLSQSYDRGLHLRPGDGHDGLRISRTDLKKVEKQLSDLLNRPQLARLEDSVPSINS